VLTGAFVASLITFAGAVASAVILDLVTGGD
jgi:hypothetical protein